MFRLRNLLLLLLILYATQALKVHKLYQVSKYPITIAETFGFNAGGSLTLRGDIKFSSSGHGTHTEETVRTQVAVLSCSSKSYASLIEALKTYSCASQIEKSTCYSFPLDKTENTIQINDTQINNIVILNCLANYWDGYSQTYNVGVYLDFHAVNPGPNEVSAEKQQLPLFNALLTGAYYAIFGIYALHIVLNKEHRSIMHYLTLGAFGLKLVVFTLSAVYWYRYRMFGFRLDWLEKVKLMMYVVSETAIVFVLVLIGRGFKITRERCTASDLKLFIVGGSVLCGASAFWIGYNSDYYTISLIIMYFFFLPKVFIGIAKVLRYISTQILIGQADRGAHGIDVASLERKTAVLTNIRKLLIIATIVPFSLSYLRVIVSWTGDGMIVVAIELSQMFTILYLAWVLRCHPLGVFRMDDFPSHISLDRFLHMDHNDIPSQEVFVEPWDMSTTFVVQWPGKQDFAKPGEASQPLPLHKLPLSVCIREDYVTGEEESADSSVESESE